MLPSPFSFTEYGHLSYSVCFFSCFSTLDKIIVTGYKALQLIYFFTVGKDEVKAWTIQLIVNNHSVYFSLYKPLFSYNSTNYVSQSAGKYRQQGRNYIVEDGDIILFKFNAGAGLQGKKK
ncbi:obg-like ATPase 1 [Limulus polyphemus]|uniref:Obg-like ATPase 1 n=1 Tax=Limulus polyphemus TaxID=6850 RepID=A0ABM1TR09_LIMPO|nr:obg-like ATPase 1 [Limulus polyphemus]